MPATGQAHQLRSPCHLNHGFLDNLVNVVQQLHGLARPQARNPLLAVRWRGLSRSAAAARKQRLFGLADRALAHFDGQVALSLIRDVTAEAGGSCSLLLVQHSGEGREVVTPLYSASGAFLTGEAAAGYEAEGGDMPSVHQACSSGQPLVLRHYGTGGAGEQRYADLDAFYDQIRPAT